MNLLKREIAPITPEAWAQIDDEARRVLTLHLAARKVVDFSGPLGWDKGAVNTGRLATLKGPVESVSAPTRVVQPLVELRAYFDGRLREFKAPLDLRGTAFQMKVWRSLAEIPYGQTWTYGELAARVGRPGASRAVGAANGANPLPLILPCHRVVAAGGKLGGFGGGLDAKRRLLAFERSGLPLLS